MLLRSPDPIIACRCPALVRQADGLHPTIKVQRPDQAQQGEIVTHAPSLVGLVDHHMGHRLNLGGRRVAGSSQESGTHLVVVFAKVDDTMGSAYNLSRDLEALVENTK